MRGSMESDESAGVSREPRPLAPWPCCEPGEGYGEGEGYDAPPLLDMRASGVGGVYEDEGDEYRSGGGLPPLPLLYEEGSGVPPGPPEALDVMSFPAPPKDMYIWC